MVAQDITRQAPTLYVEPESARFGEAQEDELQRRLLDQERSSLFYPLCSEKEALLDPDGRTQTGGYRFTRWALYQLCQAVAPGLYSLVTDLSGARRLPGAVRGDYSFAEAVQALNALVRRRFGSRLYGRQVLRDHRTGVIHGVVGPTYRWLPNQDLYQRTVITARSSRRPMQFHEALLNGRWLMVRFRHVDEFFSVPCPDGSPDVFYSGFHFSNNEVGLAAVRASALIIRREGGTAAMAPLQRLAHSSSRSFDRKLEALLDGVGGRLREAEFYRARAADRLKPTLLGLGREPGGAWRTERSERRRRDDLAHLLARRVDSRTLARRIVASVIAMGSYDGPWSDMTRALRSTLASRTVYDLYNAVGREARRLTIGGQEKAEQAAYALLTGRLSLD